MESLRGDLRALVGTRERDRPPGLRVRERVGEGLEKAVMLFVGGASE